MVFRNKQIKITKIHLVVFLLFASACSKEIIYPEAIAGNSDQALKNRVALDFMQTVNGVPVKERAFLYVDSSKFRDVESNGKITKIRSEAEFYKENSIQIIERTATSAKVLIYPNDKLYQSVFSLLSEWEVVNGEWKQKDFGMAGEDVLRNIK